MVIKLNKTTAGQMALVTLPAGQSCRQASQNGRSLKWQLISAPYPNDHTGGWLLVELVHPADEIEIDLEPADAGRRKDPIVLPEPSPVQIRDRKLTVMFSGRELVFDDEINNLSLDSSEAVEGVTGVFYPFTPSAQVALCSEGPLAAVYRIRAPLTSESAELNPPEQLACTAWYDIWLFKNLPLMGITASFQAVPPVLAAKVKFARLLLDSGDIHSWLGGAPRFGGDFAGATPYVPHVQEGFRDRSFNQYALLETADAYFGYLGGTPLLKADGTTISLTPDADCENLSYDLTAYDLRRPLTGWLYCHRGQLPEEVADLLDLIPAQALIQHPPGHALTLSAGEMEAIITVSAHGAVLSSIQDHVSGLQLLQHPGALFSLHLRDLKQDRQLILDSESGWRRVHSIYDPPCLHIHFTDPVAMAGNNLSVHLSLQADPEQNRIVAGLAADNFSQDHSLLSIDYPQLHFDARADMQGLVPRGPGEIIPELPTAAVHQHFHYPAYAGSMPFMAVWDQTNQRGLYYGIHDPEGSFKHIHMESSCGLGMICADWPVSSLGQPANSCRLPGDAIWQLFTGNWYDAALIYKRWVTANARWIPRIDAQGRPDVPEWLKCAPLWLTDWVDPDGQWLEDALKAQEDLNVPTAYHVYQWHEIPFDNDYPHYFPAREAFVSRLSRLRAAGIKIMPYINGRLWDTRDKGVEDDQFTAVALPASTKNRHGQPIVESYLSKEEDGSPVRLAVMCPSTAVWQDKLKSIVDRLFREIGVDAVYIDQVAAARPQLCMDPAHAHRPGGGSWWQACYEQLMQQLRLVVPHDRGYTTECNGEIYMRQFDAYLTWHWTRANQVPAFSAVYAAYIPMFGRCFGARAPGDDDAVRILAAQSLLFGEQIGWIKPSDYLSLQHRDFFRKVVRTRHCYGSYFYAGFLCPPVQVSSDLPDLVALNVMGGNRVISSPAVLAAAWQRQKDRKCLLLLVNLADQSGTASIQLRADCPAVDEASLAGDLAGPVCFTRGKAELTLPALSVSAIEYEP